MSVVQLGELMATKTPSLNPAQYQDEEFELWSIPAFDAGAPERLRGGEIGSVKKVVQPGDVLLSRIVPHIRRSWVVSKSADGLRQIGSGEWIIFRSERVDPNYLRHFLISDVFHSQFMQTVAGVGGSLLRARPEGVKAISFYLPSLGEQKRIAAILDQADELRRKRQRAIKRLNKLGQAIFIEMFGGLEGSDVEPLGSLTLKIGSGATPKGGDSSYKAEGIPLIRSMNVRDGHFLDKGLAFIDDDQASKLDNVVVEGGDVLLNITGASVARVCTAPASMGGARVNQHVSIIRPTERLLSVFVEAYLLLPMIKKKLMNIAESGATRQAITKTQIEQLAIPVPPIARQNEFARRVGNVQRQQDSSSSHYEHLESLFGSLQHRAFAGEL